jgi:hypothetical protein
MRKTLWLIGATMLIAMGCSETPVQNEELTIFDQTSGGFETTSEAPAFGNSELLAEASEEVDPGDPLTASITADAASDSAKPHLIFGLRAIWGQLRPDTTSTTPMVWDGSASIDSGRIGVLRTIRFEPATDYLLPRTADATVEWASITTVHNDGLLLLLGTKAPTLTDSSDNMVHLTIGPVSLSMTLRELATLDTIIHVDDFGNAVMLNGMLRARSDCPRGYLGGHWQANDDSAGVGGTFDGRWVTDNGETTGHLKGRYGVNSNGRKVFFGKVINSDGNFRGFLRGIWGPVDGRPGGFFTGVYFNAMDIPVGRVFGHYRVNRSDSTTAGREGVFQGVWKKACPSWDAHGARWQDWLDANVDDVDLDAGLLDGSGI